MLDEVIIERREMVRLKFLLASLPTMLLPYYERRYNKSEEI